MELMDKVRQVGESYELNKYKTLNRTIELDARLANDRLLATKLRLNQVNATNEKLNKQLRLAQQQVRDQDKKILVTETMLRQFVGGTGGGAGVDGGAQANKSASPKPAGGPKWSKSNRLAGKFGAKKSSTGSGKAVAGASSRQTSSSANETNDCAAGTKQPNGQQVTSRSSASRPEGGDGTPKSNDNKTNYENSATAATLMAALKSQQAVAASSSSSSFGPPARQVNSSATQTAQPSRTRTIINELRQRLNLAVGGGGGASSAAISATGEFPVGFQAN